MGVGDGNVSRDRQPGVRGDGEGRIQPGESWPLLVENAQLKGWEGMGVLSNGPFIAPPAGASSTPVINTTPHLPQPPQPGLSYMRQCIIEELGPTFP